MLFSAAPVFIPDNHLAAQGTNIFVISQMNLPMKPKDARYKTVCRTASIMFGD